jgi:hypothetical protein
MQEMLSLVVVLSTTVFSLNNVYTQTQQGFSPQEWELSFEEPYVGHK